MRLFRRDFRIQRTYPKNGLESVSNHHTPSYAFTVPCITLSAQIHAPATIETGFHRNANLHNARIALQAGYFKVQTVDCAFSVTVKHMFISYTNLPPGIGAERSC